MQEWGSNLWTSIVLRIGDLSSSSLVHMAQSSPLLSYLESHGVQEKLTLAIKSVLKNRPAEPLKAIGHALVQSASAPAASLAICSWNMAAINNNPFEYWLTHTDPEYATLMEKVEDFMQSPGDKDVPVEAIFTQEMFDKLDTHMTKQGWEGQAECAQYWSELRSKTIISGFLKDKALGDKRLMSIPDRMTNTIDVLEGACAYRPTPVSSYEGDIPNVAKWWPLWRHFIFEQKLTIPGKKGAASSEKLPCELLGKIPRSKYPALTEEEENMSVRLQAVCLAVFDCILVHMLHTLSNDGKWLDLKKKILESLTHAKEPKQINILKNAYAGTDVIFLQEVRTSTMRTALPAAFGDKYTVHFPNSPSKADQVTTADDPTDRGCPLRGQVAADAHSLMAAEERRCPPPATPRPPRAELNRATGQEPLRGGQRERPHRSGHGRGQEDTIKGLHQRRRSLRHLGRGGRNRQDAHVCLFPWRH